MTPFKNLVLVATLVAISFGVKESVAATATSKKLRSSVTAIQTVPLNSTTSTFTLLSGVMGYGGDGLKIQPDNNSGSPTAIASLPVLSVTSSMTKEDIAAQAKTTYIGYASAIASALKTWMATNNYKTGSFIYEQEVQPVGLSHTMKLVWQVSVIDGGRVVHGVPRVVDSDPSYVYATYTPKSVAVGLPAAWSPPDAGLLKWQLRRRDGTPVTDWATINTNGAFDEPTLDGVDPNWGVNCLANMAYDATCPVAYGDVKGLIAANSASSAIIDYVRKVQPVYTPNGDGTQSPSMSVSFDSRNLTHNHSCSNGTYRNTGRFGFTLQNTLDRFSFDPKVATPNLLNRMTSTGISPTQGFDFSQVTALSQSQLDPQVINPFDSGGSLIASNTVPGMSYLAPISEDGSTGLVQESISYNGQSRTCSSSDPWIGNLYGPSGAISTVQQCGGHFWWGTDYSFGIDRATGQGWTVHWWYGTQSLIDAVTVTTEELPCPH